MAETEQNKEEKKQLSKTWIIAITGLVIIGLIVIVVMLWKAAPKVSMGGAKRKWGSKGGSCGCAAGMPPP